MNADKIVQCHTTLEGVSTHGCAMRVRGVENPQGFGMMNADLLHLVFMVFIGIYDINRKKL
ncbi:MAG: hypothetical protein KKD46_01600 [Euryarchaeota archaeon]|nr:hypothetical protein [Euryarchaeota archaeon]MBU4220683.1 hypothetical protein [Euryarchaeota archaeon]MBU4339604.1 hypothetical protein [Euryarchaeota archaeon]MCG2735013.1 hypothetical protein [Candidatus Methanoperedenaceae archaeon]